MTIPGPDRTERHTYRNAAWIFLRLLGVVYVFAFWSLALQIRGLVGHDGILPAHEYLSAVKAVMETERAGPSRFWLWPTIFWLDSSDGFLQAVTVAGTVAGGLLAIGIAPGLLAPLLWAGYLSLSVVCGEFLGYQWDALLLEAGLLAIPLARATWWDRPRDAADPPRIARWLLWWLLFRLVFGSGIVKLASGDPTWRDLTALAAHYETQPLPTPIAWYASQLPLWAHRATTLTVLVLELATPWLVFGSRRGRLIACAANVALQLGIAITGNYAFFNLLTIALCMLLLDDARLRRGAEQIVEGRRAASPARLSLATAWLLALATVPVSVAALTRQLGMTLPGSSLVSSQAAIVEPLRSVNSYGLFAVMTTTRPEIIVEGSSDGATWLPYELKYKPGDPLRAPKWIAPFQPRLDWQMWFAALGRYEEEAWFQRFCSRLLERSPSVMRLVAHDPFNGAPPRFIRATLYRYRFSRRATAANSEWWTREELGPYAPAVRIGN